MTGLAEFLFPAPAPRRTGAILRWWEKRRLSYNLVVGGAGLFSLITVAITTTLPPDGETVVLLGPAAVFGIVANVCYCLGPTVEATVEKLWGGKLLPLGPVLFRMGLTFSVGLALMPAAIGFLDWGVRILKWIL